MSADTARREIESIYNDHDDLFPWKWTAWTAIGQPGVGGITSPNGSRSDGSSHTYWLIAGDIDEPHGRLICEAVNAWVKPGWRARLGRWLLGGDI